MRLRQLVMCGVVLATAQAAFAQNKEPLFPDPIDVQPKPIAEDGSVTWDYDIVYVRAGRAGDEVHKRFYTDFSRPVTMEPGADLMLLRPDGSEELLVAGGKGSITDPFVSFDGQWVYYVHIYNLEKASQWSPPREGADIFKIHLPTRKIVRLTNQRFSPNTGAAEWSSDFRTHEEGKTHFDYGVYNMGPCPLPGDPPSPPLGKGGKGGVGGRIVFTSNRDGFRPAKGYPAIALQMFVMDDRDESIGEDEDPQNLEKIGHLNISGALHPVVLNDGRIMFSSLESQGIRGEILWGLWTIHPDGTNWNPLVSAFDPGGAPNGFHFQTQLSDGSIIVEEYYNQNNSGFGAYIKLPPTPPLPPLARGGKGEALPPLVRGGKGGLPSPAFGPGWMHSDRNKPWRYGRFDNGKGQWYRMPFMPTGSVSLTPFSHGREGPANHAVLADKNSPAVGKFTHPSAAPDNHLLTIYSPGPVNHQYKYLPQLDGGIYLLKNGDILEQPADLVLIKNDPLFNESWPRAVVPWERIYGTPEPQKLPELVNDGSRSKHLPEGTPFGLVGTSSLYKRESYPNGDVPEGEVTARWSGEGNLHGPNDPWRGLDAFTSHGNGMPLNWHNQGADAGLYSNSDIHAVRILAMEPTTDRHRGANSGRRFYNHATERLRILGEIPVRKFAGERDASASRFTQPPGSRAADEVEGTQDRGENREADASRSPGSRDSQPLDPDGNPDTSFLAKLPADTAFTFQTVDKDGMVLNMAQTWHQLRPGEIRHDCGGCHAHSQQPTDFSLTMAARPDYKVWDLTAGTPLITDKSRDESQHKWDADDATDLRTAAVEVVNVEYHRDIRPILARNCVACHTSKDGKSPAGNLDLDADGELVQVENLGKFPGTYVRLAADERAQFGHKPVGYDSWGYPNASRYIRKFQSRRSLLTWKLFGRRLDGFTNDDHPSESKPGARDLVQQGEPVDMQRNRARWDLDHVGSPMPPPAAVEAGKVQPLSDEDRRTIVCWIDLGCPIDLDFNPDDPEQRGYGWMLDDNRPILALTEPRPGSNDRIDRILVGLHDYYTGLDMESFTVTADFAIDGLAAGENLAARFKEKSRGVRELRLEQPITDLPQGRLTVSVRDGEGNLQRIVRTISVP